MLQRSKVKNDPYLPSAAKFAVMHNAVFLQWMWSDVILGREAHMKRRKFITLNLGLVLPTF
jgi:hypothetical protein